MRGKNGNGNGNGKEKERRGEERRGDASRLLLYMIDGWMGYGSKKERKGKKEKKKKEREKELTRFCCLHKTTGKEKKKPN